MKKRTLSLLLVLILVVAMVPVSARAANTYDAQKAVAWASNDSIHRQYSYNSTGIECAEYVSLCLQQGGMPIPTYRTPGDLKEWIRNNG